MEATVVLTGVSNFVRLPDGATENRLHMRLPTGQVISSVISDEDLAAVAAAFSGAPSEKRAAQEAPAEEESASSDFEKQLTEDGNEALIFGGARAEPPPAPPVEDLPPVPPPPRKARLVGKDEAGNPIVEFEGAQSMDEVTGTLGHRDEDGVAQL